MTGKRKFLFLAAALGLVACAGAARAADPAGGELRILTGLAGWDWVDDTRKLEEKLRFAGTWGYNAFSYAFNAPALTDARGDTNWHRDSGTAFRWRLSDGRRKGHADARGALLARIRNVRDAAERQGFEFIPAWGPLGWGNTLTLIDPSTAAGAYYEMEIPDSAGEAFLLKAGNPKGAVESAGQWGDAGGRADIAFSPDGVLLASSVRIRKPGMRAAQFMVKPGRDGYWRLEADLGPLGGGDSAFLKAYHFRGWEAHPLSTRLIARAGLALGAGGGLLEAAFFSKAAERYLVDVEVHSRAPAGGGVRIRRMSLKQAVPPRETLINSSAYEAAARGAPSFLDRMVSAGHAGEARCYTLVSSRKRGLKDAKYHQLDPEAGRAAWESLSAVRGHFADQDGGPSRHSVDPLSPATRQIFLEVARVAALAAGRKPARYLMGGDEVFSWGSRRYSQPPYAGMDRGALLATLFLERMGQLDSVFAALYPSDRGGISYILYGDMFTSLHGIGEGTLGGLKTLAAGRPGPGRILLAPWYYDQYIAQSGPLYRKLGFPDTLPDLEKFGRLLRKDAGDVSGAGLDFLGVYSTDGPRTGLKDEIDGARAWAGTCRDIRGRGPGEGRCRGMIYAGWDLSPRADWGNEYNGLLATAWFGWVDPAGSLREGRPFADLDRDGVLDALEEKRPGPYRARSSGGGTAGPAAPPRASP